MAVAPEVVPLQTVELTPVEESILEEQREATSAVPIYEETTAEGQPAVEVSAEAGIDEPVSLPIEADVVNEGISPTDEVDVIIEQILAETAKIGIDEDDQDAGTSDVGDKIAETADGEKHWFNLSYEEIIVQMTERPVVTPSDTNEEMGTIVGTDVVDVPLPSAGVEITKITLGKDIKIPGVDEWTWYMASLPHIQLDDKGKKPLQEKDPVKGNPVKEQFLLIVADIDLLVQLREQIIDDVEQFFNSLSIKKLAHLKIHESYFHKKELVLSWGEAESTRVALNRRLYILTKYREVLIRKILDARVSNFEPSEGSSAIDLKEIIVQITERPVVTPSDTDEEMGTIFGTDVDEAMSLDDILMTIPVDVPLPSAGVEITKITLGKDIKIPGVDEWTWYMASLPHIQLDDKGKKPLQEKDPVKGNPVKEQFLLIVADIDLLVQLREQIIDDVEQFFNSLSIKKLAHLKIHESYFHKKELVLSWGEAESTRVALNRRLYILTKYREVLIRKILDAHVSNFELSEGSYAIDLKVLDMLIDLHRFILEDLKDQAIAHGLTWKKPCCSTMNYWQPITRTVTPSEVEVPRQ
ncbi:hypothetical protein F511_43526 [Dorcoceras hygrometricum]|uniref:Uncharacterized protein n=1 Tax=Dorcoceras hygrometricum TaxID=472368 RepID=A0A2Z7B0Q4_9LAMI|nr:hypothetical protein F511_43526 [Dorcoceras hygrometricum]